MHVTNSVVLAHRLVFEEGSSLAKSAIGMIRRQLGMLERAGVKHVCIVDGEHAVALENRLKLDQYDMEITVRPNRSWQRASGAALLVAQDFIEAADSPVLVLPGDRPLHEETVAKLVSVSLSHHDAAIVACSGEGTDLPHEERIRVKMDDASTLSAIGLDLDRFDALFTGHAVVTPKILSKLKQQANPSIADGIRRLRSTKVVSGTVHWPWGAKKMASMTREVEAILGKKNHPHFTLLNPGPVNTTAAVKSALVHHDVCHRDSNFTELMVSLTHKLRRIYRGNPDEHSVVMMTGSGTAGMEASISSSVPQDRAILIVDNGAFGERMREICEVHGLNMVHLRYPWGNTVSPADVERKLKEYPEIAVVAMVHHETSVGLLNPITEVGALCRKFNKLFLVDAVSSLGAEEIDVVRDNIDICYGSANKCLHAISGAAYVCVSNRAWQRMESVKPRSMYLDLRRYQKYMSEMAQTPFTPAVSAYFALDAACDEFLADGHEARFDSYRRRNRRLRAGLRDLGAYALTQTGVESHSVVTCSVPDGVTFADLYESLKLRGYIVYGCKSVLAERFFQVANMGDVDEDTIDDFLAAMADALADLRGEKSKVTSITSRAIAS